MSEENQARNREPSRAVVFCHILPRLLNVARRHGYALGVHGSMATDMDLIAVPWIENASSEETLIEAIRIEVDGFISSKYNDIDLSMRGLENPCLKPHGRRAWSIYFHETEVGWGPYLDISVMPRVEEKN